MTSISLLFGVKNKPITQGKYRYRDIESVVTKDILEREKSTC